MQSQSNPQIMNTTNLNTPDHSIAGVFAGTGFSLFGFLILIALLA